jgi:glycosyltransferase involved in cell wall biosynthesis
MIPAPQPWRVMYVQPNSAIGGSDVSLLRIIEKLDRRRFEPIVALPASGPLTHEFEKRGARVFIVAEMLPLTTRRGALYPLRYVANYPLAVRALKQLIARERADLVHTNSLHSLYGFASARRARVPHVWHVREIVTQSPLVRQVERRLALHFADRIVAVSDAAAAIFRDADGRLPAHVHVIPNGVDIDAFHPKNDGSRIRAAFGIDARSPLVGIVGRLDRGKGIDIFLRAAALCRAQFPSARFIVCGGEVPGHESVTRDSAELARELGLGESVTFTQWKLGPADMPELFAALDLVVSASTIPESFGRTLIEAMASGKPVIATDHGGPREVCVDGETAHMIPPGDAQLLANAMLELLRRPQEASRMGAAGRKRAEELFDECEQMRRLEQLYEDVLGNRAARRELAGRGAGR